MNHIILICLLLTPGALADHLPRNQTARGNSEHLLSGIDIHTSSAASLFDRLGKPASYKKHPETEEAAEIVWNKDGSVIHATINVDQIAYAVEVSGKPGPSTQTGAGLMLGNTVTDLKRIYGSKFSRHTNEVDLQWNDGTELRVRFVRQKIVSILLLANVE